MQDLSQGWIKRDFVSTKVVGVIKRAGLHSCESSGTERCDAVMLGINNQLHRSGKHLLSILKQLAAHLVSKGNQSCLLLLIGLIINQKNRFCRVRVGIRVAQSSPGLDGRGNGVSVQCNTIPTSALNVPGEDRFIAYEIDFSVGEALPGVHIGAAGFDVVAVNLLCRRQDGEDQEYRTNKS